MGELEEQRLYRDLENSSDVSPARHQSVFMGFEHTLALG